MKYKVTILLAVLFTMNLLLYAQEKPLAVISYTTSNEVLVLRNNKKVVFQDPIGLELYAGDQIQTGRGVSAEIQFSKPSGVLKMTENTTLVIEKLKNDATINIRLIYGRIRTKISKLVGNESFSITSAQATAGVRGTDFGFEVLTPRVALNPIPVTKVYCFDGEVRVIAYIDVSSGSSENLETVPKEYTIKNSEMVVVERKDSRMTSSLQSLEYGLTEYWSTQPIMTDPANIPALPKPRDIGPLQLPSLTFTGDEGAAQNPVEQPADNVNILVVNDEVFKNRLLATSRLKDAGILGSIILCTAGAGIKGLGWYYSSIGDAAQAGQFNLFGDILFASAVPFLIFSIVIQPQ